MAETGSRSDPFVAFRFEVRIDEISVAGFTECNGIQLETEVFDYAEGGANDRIHRFPTRTRQSNLTLRRGIADKDLWDWYYDLTQGKVKRHNGLIAVKDHDGQKVTMEWQFTGAFPSKWVGPELNASQSAVAVETLELTYKGLVRRT